MEIPEYIYVLLDGAKDIDDDDDRAESVITFPEDDEENDNNSIDTYSYFFSRWDAVEVKSTSRSSPAYPRRRASASLWGDEVSSQKVQKNFQTYLQTTTTTTTNNNDDTLARLPRRNCSRINCRNKQSMLVTAITPLGLQEEDSRKVDQRTIFITNNFAPDFPKDILPKGFLPPQRPSRKQSVEHDASQEFITDAANTKQEQVDAECRSAPELQHYFINSSSANRRPSRKIVQKMVASASAA